MRDTLAMLVPESELDKRLNSRGRLARYLHEVTGGQARLVYAASEHVVDSTASGFEFCRDFETRREVTLPLGGIAAIHTFEAFSRNTDPLLQNLQRQLPTMNRMVRTGEPRSLAMPHAILQVASFNPGARGKRSQILVANGQPQAVVTRRQNSFHYQPPSSQPGVSEATGVLARVARVMSAQPESLVLGVGVVSQGGREVAITGVTPMPIRLPDSLTLGSYSPLRSFLTAEALAMKALLEHRSNEPPAPFRTSPDKTLRSIDALLGEME